MPYNDIGDSGEYFLQQIGVALQPVEPVPAAFEFLDPKRDMPRYLIGRNEESVALQKLIRIDGIIDDFSVETRTPLGTPIVKSHQVPGHAWVVNCSTSISPVNVSNRLNTLALQHSFGLFQIIQASQGSLAWPWFVQQQRHSLQSHSKQWAALYTGMDDQESRQTLLDVIRYRLTANYHYMCNYPVRMQEQYFEPFMDYSREVFVDAGGYDGDTTEAFCRRYPDYRKVYLFEPSPLNMQAARLRLAEFGAIHFKQLALSDQNEWLNFNCAQGSACSVSENATERVEARRLDEVTDGDVTVIKMDLEGWELKALAGAEKLIRNNHCKLAIAVYHRADDFLDIPNFVAQLNPSRQIFLRHYTQGWSETIMYFR